MLFTLLFAGCEAASPVWKTRTIFPFATSTVMLGSTALSPGLMTVTFRISKDECGGTAAPLP
jgi:hypothetical protein